MKRLFRLACILLSVVLVLSAPAAAMENAENRASNFFGSSDVFISMRTSTQFRVWFEVSALGIMDKVGASEIKVQKSSDGENWTTMKTYNMDDYTNMICENTGSHTSYVTYTGQTGYYYRAKITLYAENSSGVGEWIRYTSSVLL